MPVSKTTRVRGNRAPYIEIAGIDRAYELTKASVTNDDPQGDATYTEAEQFERSWAVEYEGKQNTDAESLQSFIWDNPGVEVSIIVAPQGNKVPAAGKPHYRGTVKLGDPGQIGTDADRDGGEGTFSGKIQFLEKPVKDYGTDPKPVIDSITPGGQTPGSAVSILGARLTGANAVKFGNTVATSIPDTDNRIIAVVPTGVTGKVDVTVVTPTGTSAAKSYTASA